MIAIPLAPRGLGYDPMLACRHLHEADPVLGGVMERVGGCTLRPEPTQSLFAALARAIVYQQLSGRAAATILGRVHAIYAPRRSITPRDILATTPATLGWGTMGYFVNSNGGAVFNAASQGWVWGLEGDSVVENFDMALAALESVSEAP